MKPMSIAMQLGASPDTDIQVAEQYALEALRVSASWRPRISEAGIRISTGMLPHVRLRGYRSDVDFPAPAQELVMLIADQMVERLGDWNEEFVEGRRLTTLSEQPGCVDWLFHVWYRTPGPLANREYLYRVRKRTVSDTETCITYQSVVDAMVPVRKGYVRGQLLSTVHRVLAAPDGCRVEHVLATDLGGLFPRWVQNHLLTGALLQANLRDARKQRGLFERADAAGANRYV
jgi:hypothetical protein